METHPIQDGREEGSNEERGEAVGLIIVSIASELEYAYSNCGEGGPAERIVVMIWLVGGGGPGGCWPHRS